MKKFLKVAGLVIAIPVGLFIILAVLLYVPAIQNFVVDKVTGIASEKTGMQIRVDNVRLGFPLSLRVNGVDILSHRQDTLLSAGQLQVDVQLLPLLRKQIEVDGVSLKDVRMNTEDLIPSVALQGTLGEFYLSSHGVALDPEIAIVNKALLRRTHLTVSLRDTTTTDTTETSSPTYWKILVKSLQCEDVDVALHLTDTTRMAVGLDNLDLQGGEIDLRHAAYSLRRLVVKDGAFSMDNDTLEALPGLDPAHLSFTQWNAEIDSASYQGRRMAAVIRNFALNERSGLQVRSFTGRLDADDEAIRLPELRLETSDSYVETRARIDWKALEGGGTADMSVRLLAELGKQDLMLLAGGMPEAFVRAYPNAPLTLRAGVDGNMQQLKLTGLQSELKGVYELSAKGEVYDVLDNRKRRGEVVLDAVTHDLDCVAALAGLADSTLVIPRGITFKGNAGVAGEQYTADLVVTEGTGRVELQVDCRTDTETYDVTLAVDSLYGRDFLPHDSLYYVSATLAAHGRGFDPYHPATHAQADLSVERLQYAAYDLTDLKLRASLAKGDARLEFDSRNPLLAMTTTLDAQLRRRGVGGRLLVDLADVNLPELQVASFPFHVGALFTLDFRTDFRKTHWCKGALENLSFRSEKNNYKAKNLYFNVDLRPDSTCINADAGDLNLHLDGRRDIQSIIRALSTFGTELAAQAEDKWLDQNKLKALLPDLCLRLKVGTDNPIYNYLAMNGFKYDELFADFDTSPLRGINGTSHIYCLRTDSLQLDTIRLNMMQDSLGVKLFAEVRNAPTNRQFVFDSRLNAFIHPKGAGLELNYYDSKGEQGVHLGLNATMADDGLRFKFYPEQPIIAFSPYRLNRDNYIYLHKNGHVEADLRLDTQDGGRAFQLYSAPDTDAWRDLTVSLHRVDIGKLMQVLPYLPDIEGILDAELHYIQADRNSLSVAFETAVDSLVYEHTPVGDIACSGIYLPKEDNTHFVDARLSLDEEEVVALSGDYHNTGDGLLDMTLGLKHFPLKLANGFIPDRMVTLSGDLDGEVAVKGRTAAPVIDGQLALDSVMLVADAYGARFRLDNRPVTIEGSKLKFDNFSVYTRGSNPFALTGTVDFSNLTNTLLDLRMVARNYELINAPRQKNSVVFGKVYVDIFSTLKGDMNNLKMRGNINVQGNTDVTYILKDSPLTVEDRLSGLVTFVDFRDTTTVLTPVQPVYTAGGVDMLMTLQIDEGAQVRANLSEDGESYIALNGGGTLSMQYTPQGEFLLSGRYTVVGGQMKYALPVIPLKTFTLKNGSYVEFNGNPMNPVMNIAATERVRTTVTENDVPRSVNFDVGVAITNSLENMGLEFTLEAPEDAGIQNQLVSMSKEDRGKLAVAMLATGMYLGEGGGSKSNGFSANSALNSFLQSEITNIAGNALKTVDITVGMEDATSADGSQHTDYSFRFAKRFWNNRISIVIGGRISTGNDDPNKGGMSESFIDDISVEYRLDNSGTRYIRVFHNTNFDSMLDGEITETGAGIVLRKKVSKLSELFIFRKRKQSDRNEQPRTEK